MSLRAAGRRLGGTKPAAKFRAVNSRSESRAPGAIIATRNLQLECPGVPSPPDSAVNQVLFAGRSRRTTVNKLTQQRPRVSRSMHRVEDGGIPRASESVPAVRLPQRSPASPRAPQMDQPGNSVKAPVEIQRPGLQTPSTVPAATDRPAKQRTIGRRNEAAVATVHVLRAPQPRPRPNQVQWY